MKIFAIVLLGLVIGGAAGYAARPWYVPSATSAPSETAVVTEPVNSAENESESSDSARPIGGIAEDDEQLIEITTDYYIFNQAQYESALEEHEIVLLYFCSDQDPICAVETPDIEDGFDELSGYDVAGFYIRYGMDDASGAEKAIAEEYSVKNQHTKIIIVDGDEEVRATDAWTTPRFLEAFEEL